MRCIWDLSLHAFRLLGEPVVLRKSLTAFQETFRFLSWFCASILSPVTLGTYSLTFPRPVPPPASFSR